MLCVRKPGNAVSENSKRFPSKSGVRAYYSRGEKAMHTKNDLDLDDLQRKYERNGIFSNYHKSRGSYQVR